MGDIEYINSIVSKCYLEKIIKQIEVQVEIGKAKKGKKETQPRLLVMCQYRILLFEMVGKNLKERRYTEICYFDIASLELGDANKKLVIKYKSQRAAAELELLHDQAADIAKSMRDLKHENVPDWPEIGIIGLPSSYQPSTETTFETQRASYLSLCNYYNVPHYEGVCMYFQNKRDNLDTDFVVSELPGIDTNGNSEKDPLHLFLAPVIVSLRYDSYFKGLIVNNINNRREKEIVGLIAQVVRNNSNLTKLQLINSEPDTQAFLDLCLALKENRSLKLQIIDLSDNKCMDHRCVYALASTLTTYPIPRLSHLNLGKCALPAKGVTKLFQAFQMNYFISLGITHLNLAGAKFDSDATAAAELWLEMGANYSHLEELVLSNVGGLPFKSLYKFKSLPKMTKLDLSGVKLDSSSDAKQVGQLLADAPNLRFVDLSSCGIEKSSVLEAIIDGIKKMKFDGIGVALSENPAFATDSKWIKSLQGSPGSPAAKLSSLVMNNIHFNSSILEDMIHAFKSSSILKELKLNDSKAKLKNPEVILNLLEYPCLQSLSLSNSLGESVQLLLKELCTKNKTITNLDVSNNQLGDDAATYVASLIQQNAFVISLSVDGNNFSYSAWQSIYQSLRRNNVLEKLYFPHSDMDVMYHDWANTPIRRGYVMKLIFQIRDWIESTSRFGDSAKKGELSIFEFKPDWNVPTPMNPLAVASIPSHLASNLSEMKLEEWDIATASSISNPTTSTDPSSAEQPSSLSRSNSIRSNSVVYRPSASDVFQGQKDSPPIPSGLSSSSPNRGLPSAVPAGVTATTRSNSSPLVPKNPLPKPPGTPGKAPPPLPSTLPPHLRSNSTASLSPPSIPPMHTDPPQQHIVDDIILYPSTIKFNQYGQVDEDIDTSEPVRAATLNEMVIRLASESASDVKFMHTFLLTYRATVEPAELLDRLITRFFLQPPEFAGTADQKSWQDQKLRPIRLRVMNVLKRWCEAHWQDFNNNPTLISTLESFLREPAVTKQHDTTASMILGIIQRQSQIAKSPLISGTLRSTFDQDFAIADNSGSASSHKSGLIGFFAKYSPEELAEQICLLENELFLSLQIKEFFNLSWNKGTNEQKDTAAPNIRLMIKVSNQIITWAAYEILRQPTANARAKAISRAIQLCEALKARNNMNGLKEVSAGLCLSSVQRLKKSWALVKPKFKQLYNDLTDLCQNMNSLRNFVHNAAPPLVPYLGLYLTDLVFIEDGNQNTFDEDGTTLINFRKMSIMGEVLMEISSYQQDRYTFLKNDIVYNYFLMMDAKDDEALHKLSVMAEPKK